jgi:hypothetical protein
VLVDARWPPPDPEPEHSRFPWAALVRPGLAISLLVVGMLGPPIVTYLCVITALCCAAESFAMLVPRTGGMKDYRQ